MWSLQIVSYTSITAITTDCYSVTWSFFDVACLASWLRCQEWIRPKEKWNVGNLMRKNYFGKDGNLGLINSNWEMLSVKLGIKKIPNKHFFMPAPCCIPRNNVLSVPGQMHQDVQSSYQTVYNFCCESMKFLTVRKTRVVWLATKECFLQWRRVWTTITQSWHTDQNVNCPAKVIFDAKVRLSTDCSVHVFFHTDSLDHRPLHAPQPPSPSPTPTYVSSSWLPLMNSTCDPHQHPTLTQQSTSTRCTFSPNTAQTVRLWYACMPHCLIV